ncbi:MAG: DegT/DnrJ/EryC1/StrS family aminotransferase [Nitrospiraceae bacterium]|nr:DegT/DnrJ/EryC1/StrS family aminotransferase [Nitrospiraceae bacterium]
MNIPLLDLKAQYQSMRSEILAAIEATCDDQGFILGPRVAALEQAIAKYVGSSHGIGVASGSDALLLALMALGVRAGDEVVTVPFTFFATAGAISRLGAKPVFVDIRPDTFNMDPALLERAITSKTKAIIPVHLFGQCADMDAINQIAKRHKIGVIEDACQAIGAGRGGKRAGVLGDLACFSFFPSKNLGGFGDGGMVTTNDKAVAESIAMLRVHGSRVRYVHEAIGINSRLDALQAAILLVKLKRLDDWAEGRRKNAARYQKLFADAKLQGRVTLPTVEASSFHVFNQFTLRVQKRDELRAYLKDKGVGTEVYYPVPMHLQNCYRDLGHQKGSFPQSERAAEEVLSLPIYAELSDEQLQYVVQTIAEFYRTH